MNVHKIDPLGPEGLGATYAAQADGPYEVRNKWNWKCGACGQVYLNRWKAQECCAPKREA
jgi:hypothetical protein